ncbi:MAG: fibronectin type III domain-containing protein, partial [Gammaproteobacteria bacterium]
MTAPRVFALRAVAAAVALLGVIFDASAQTPEVQFATDSVQVSRNETAGRATISIRVVTDITPTSAFTLNFSITHISTSADDIDAAAAGTSILFGTSEMSEVISITILGDAVGESDEVFTVTLLPGAGYTLGARTTSTVTILNDDCKGTPTFATLSFSVEGNPAALAPAFDPNVCEYTLTIPEGFARLTPTYTFGGGGIAIKYARDFLLDDYGVLSVALNVDITEIVFNVVAGSSQGEIDAGRRYTFTLIRVTDYTPTSVSAQPGQTTLDVSWSPPADNAAGDATYVARWATTAASGTYLNPGGASGAAVAGGANARSLTISQLASGTQHNVQVGGVNPAGETFWSAIATAKTLSTPGAPGGVRAAATTTARELALSWSA